MLNDIYSIERSFSAHGVPVGAVHPDVKDMAKGSAFRLRLDSSAALVGVELIDDAGRGAVWTLRDGQHNGFPGLKTKAALLVLDKAGQAAHDEIWKKTKEPADRRDELRRLARQYARQAGHWPEAGHRGRIAERLDVLRVLTNDPQAAAVPAVFERFLRAVDAEPNLLARFTDFLMTALDTRGDDWLEPIRSAFTGQAALVIDAPVGEFPRAAADPAQIAAVSAALAAEPGEAGVCALSGARGALHSGNFPQPNLPGLGQTYLYSRNKDIPALVRYGHIADGSFAIGGALAQRLGGVLNFLTKEESRDKNWRLIPAETGDKLDLLLTSLPAVRMLATNEDDGEDVDPSMALTELGRRFSGQLTGNGDPSGIGDGELSVLVLRTVDPANRKAIYSRQTSVENVRAALFHWHAALANLPGEIGFVLPVKGERVPVLRRPTRVAPLSLVPLTRVLFANGGTRRVDVVGATAGEAMGLFLREGNTGGLARKLLRLFLLRHGALLGALSVAARKGTEALKDFDPKTDLRRDALRSLAWFGVLLFFIGRQKEDYMSGAAYRLGQLLSAADVIHIGYCADMRGGDVPPVLIGNAVFNLAGSNPVRALDVLSQRFKPYLAWAKKSHKLSPDDKSARAFAVRKALSQARRISPLASELAPALHPFAAKTEVPGDTFRAELLLGYLVGLPKPGKTTNPNSPDPIAEHEGDAE